MVKNPLANAGDARDWGLIPESGRSPEGRNVYRLQWKIPWTEEAGGLQSTGLQVDKEEGGQGLRLT